MPSTMHQIAREMGVSVATVSLALRDMGRMSPLTRARIKAAAVALDYAANPVISKACSLARRSHTANYRETIAFLVEWPMEEAGYYVRALFDGARERAIPLGCKLEVFVMSAKRADQKRLSRILAARGIRGLIIAPRLLDTHPRLHLEWKNFAPVQIFNTVWNPPNLHHVGTTDYLRFLEAMHLLKRVGYKRIGMAIEPRQDYHHRGVFNAAYLMLQSKIRASKRIPPLLAYGPWSEATLKKWLERYRPDVLYIHHNPDILEWLKNLGLRVPEDISLFCQNAQEEKQSGLRRDYQRMGRSAVEMAWLLLGNNAIGLSGEPYCWLVDELWQAGKTLSRPVDAYLTEEGLLAAGTRATSALV